MGSRGAAPTLQLMVVATLASVAAIFVSTSTSAAQGCPSSTLQVTSGGVRLPEGSEDGVYLATVVVDEQGVEQHEVKYLGKSNLTLGSWPWANDDDDSRPGGGRMLLQQEGLMCQWGFQMTPADISTAIISMGSWLGSESQFWSDAHLLSVSGGELAYSCDFSGATQWDTGTTVYTDRIKLNNVICLRGGWNSYVDWGSASGRTFLTARVCV